MRKVLILTVLATLLFATSALAFDAAVSVETRCFNISPYCDSIYIDWQFGGQIWGYDDNCGGIPFVVGGWIYSKTDWVLFLDFDEDDGASFDYAVIKGSGKNGQMYRWYPDGTPFSGDPTAIQLLGCTQAVEGGASTANE